MAKRYSEELATWLEKKTKTKRRLDTAAVAFLKVKADIIDAMERGYAMTTIWEHMRETGRVKASYETFRRHVKRYITVKIPPAKQVQVQPTKMADKPKNTQKKTTTIRGFHFNPIPNKDDLF
jgi:hypothetical protein